MKCDQCEALMINGVFCHETGCPNTHARYFEGEGWVKFWECRECGDELPVGTICTCSEPFDEEENVEECPQCGASCNGDVTIADHGCCIDCHHENLEIDGDL